LISSRGKDSSVQNTKPGCGQRGLIFDLNCISVPGFKTNEFMKVTSDADLQAQEPADRVISTVPSLCSLLPYIYFTTKYKLTALKRFLTAIRNRGVFHFQSGYMNISLICSVTGGAPSIMFI
jgi:hypothetical protein